MVNIAVSYIPVDFDLDSPEWLLRNHIRSVFSQNPGIRRVFIDPTIENGVGVVWSQDVITLPESYLNRLRSWSYNDLQNPIQTNAINNESTNNNNWDFSEQRNIPSGSQNVVTMNNIHNGNEMVNFHDRYRYGDYFKKSTYNALPRTPATHFKKINPITREPIDENYVQPYTARIVGGKKTQRKRRTLRKLVHKRKTFRR